jgi:hypothetical protein
MRLADGRAVTMRVVGQIVSMTIATFFFALFFGGEQIEKIDSATFLNCFTFDKTISSSINI